MIDKHKRWIEESPRFRRELEQKLKSTEMNELLVPYKDVAFAFPFKGPNSRSFDVPSIDQDSFILWAAREGWDARLANEKTTEKTKNWPPVHFTRK